jgi:TPR repeat protein
VLLAVALAMPGAPVHAADSVDETAVADALVLYGQGRFVEARRAFEPPATAGIASAQYHLGLLYARGEGVALDFTQAADWFTRAAEQDHGHAQFILGHMYARGEGLPRNLVQAHVWFSAAAANGWWKAREARERLVDDGMTPQEVAQAGKRYREWRAGREAARQP